MQLEICLYWGFFVGSILNFEKKPQILWLISSSSILLNWVPLLKVLKLLKYIIFIYELGYKIFFEIDKLQIAIATLDVLCDQGKIPKSVFKSALKKYYISANLEHPWNK